MRKIEKNSVCLFALFFANDLLMHEKKMARKIRN